MRVRGTGGVETTNKIGILPGYGEVWYKEGGIANIFSLSRVQKLYRVTYDSLKGNCFTIHMKEKSMHFCQSEDGLYYYDTRHEEFSLIYAVEENKRKFTYRQLYRAEEAWRVYAMIGRPSMHDNEKIVRLNLRPNCPVTVEDIKKANKIFGAEIAAL